jgi:hypothetical protein
MRIFVDESGNFIVGGGKSRTCCVAALTVPETVESALVEEFKELKSAWSDAREIKGSALSDEQMSSVLTLLGRHDVVVVATAFDVGYQPIEQLEAFRQGQAQAFVNGLTPQHSQHAHRWARELRTGWLELPLQLMAQMYTLLLTIADVIHLAPNYYAQRLPSELSRFGWVIDPKDLTPTRYEKLWERIVCPILQTMSLLEPWGRVEGFDYSGLNRFFEPIPDYLMPHLPRRRAVKDGRALSLNRVLRESVAFPDSRDEPGLQLVDAVASAITKAMNGKLSAPVWRLLGPLLLQRANREPVVRPIMFGHGPEIRASEYHRYVLKALTNRCKRMIVSDEPVVKAKAP